MSCNSVKFLTIYYERAWHYKACSTRSVWLSISLKYLSAEFACTHIAASTYTQGPRKLSFGILDPRLPNYFTHGQTSRNSIAVILYFLLSGVKTTKLNPTTESQTSASYDKNAIASSEDLAFPGKCDVQKGTDPSALLATGEW